jgi:periplasmic protein TonB
MTPAREDMAQLASNGTALALTTALLAVMFATRFESWRDSSALPASTSQPGIEVTLEPATAETPPAPQVPPPPVPRKVPVHRMTPPAAVAQIPVPEELQTMPVERDPVPEGGALVASGTPASAVPTTDHRPDLEAQYAAGLRADIDRRTHPPDSAQYRLHRPSGEVRVGFVVTRNGEPKIVRVLRSSGSAILDEAAVAIVSSGHYPPMPTQVFAGESEHVFAVTIEFRAVS